MGTRAVYMFNTHMGGVPVQVWRAVHMTPHPPQFIVSVAVLTQAVPHTVIGATHAGPVSAGPVSGVPVSVGGAVSVVVLSLVVASGVPASTPGPLSTPTPASVPPSLVGSVGHVALALIAAQTMSPPVIVQVPQVFVVVCPLPVAIV